MSRIIIFIVTLFFTHTLFSQDSFYLKVHFLYGSKPKRAFKETEPKWFGGILGGHVGIESDSNEILNFIPYGQFHWFAKKTNKHSRYTEHTENAFYGILGGNSDSVKKTIIAVPVSNQQKKILTVLHPVILAILPMTMHYLACAAEQQPMRFLLNWEF